MKVPSASPSRITCMPTIFDCQWGACMMSPRIDFSVGWGG